MLLIFDSTRPRLNLMGPERPISSPNGFWFRPISNPIGPNHDLYLILLGLTTAHIQSYLVPALAHIKALVGQIPAHFLILLGLVSVYFESEWA